MAELLSITTYPLTGARGLANGWAQVGPAGLEGDRDWVCCEMEALPEGQFGEGVDGPVYDRVSRKQRRLLATVNASIHHADGSLLLSIDDHSRLEVQDPRKATDPERMYVDEFGDRVPCYYAGDGASLALSGLLRGRTIRLARKDPEWLGGAGIDPAERKVAPIHIVNKASIDELRRSPKAKELGARFDERRFRPNLVIDGIEPFEELYWEGEVIAVGNALMRVHRPTPRCLVTGIHPDTGEQMKDVPRILRAAMEPPDEGEIGNFGVYAYPLHDAGKERPMIVVGDNVRLMKTAA